MIMRSCGLRRLFITVSKPRFFTCPPVISLTLGRLTILPTMAKQKRVRSSTKSLPKDGINDYQIADVIIVGRFIGKKQMAFKIKDKTYYMGYGHMNIFPYQFTIMRVESAKAAPDGAKP